MKEIPLTQGYVALVSDDRYKELSSFRWHVSIMEHGPRAVRMLSRSSKEGRKPMLMSRQITGAPPSMVVHHRDHDTLNNQDENLIVCSHAQNSANQRKREGCSSRFKGVSWNRASEKWEAYITVEYHRKGLGLFVKEVEAARAYNAAALEHFKEFALLNVIEEDDA